MNEESTDHATTNPAGSPPERQLRPADGYLKRVRWRRTRKFLVGSASFAWAVWEVIDSEKKRPKPSTGFIHVTIYLTDSAIHDQVEDEVEAWLETADISVDTWGKPVYGSWFRRGQAYLRQGAKTPAAREALLTAVHVADSHLVQAQDAYVTATLLQNVGPVLQALQPTKDAVVRAGALLIVKVDWAVAVYQLTAAQQAILDHEPQLAMSPKEIISALDLAAPVREQNAQQSAVQQPNGDESAIAPGN